MRAQENRLMMDTLENPKKGQERKEGKIKMEESKSAESKMEEVKNETTIASGILVMDHQLSQMQNIIVKCSLLVFFRPHAWRHSTTLCMRKFVCNNDQIDVLVIFEKSDKSEVWLWIASKTNTSDLLLLFRSHDWRGLFTLLVSYVIYARIMKVTNFMQCLSVSQFN